MVKSKHKKSAGKHSNHNTHFLGKNVLGERKKEFKITPLKVFLGLAILSILASAIYLMLPRGPAAQSGHFVSVSYVGRLDNGTLFDTNVEELAKKEGLYSSAREYAPLSFTLGLGQMIPGFESAVTGLRVGQKKTVRILPEDAYGYPQESLIRNFTIPAQTSTPISALAETGINTSVGTSFLTIYGTARISSVNSTHAFVDFVPEKGEELLLPSGSPATIAGVFRDSGNLTITIDANHPLAGQALNFEITLLALQKPLAQA